MGAKDLIDPWKKFLANSNPESLECLCEASILFWCRTYYYSMHDGIKRFYNKDFWMHLLHFLCQNYLLLLFSTLYVLVGHDYVHWLRLLMELYYFHSIICARCSYGCDICKSNESDNRNALH